LYEKSLRDRECTLRELYLCTDLLVVVAAMMNVASLQKIDKIIPLVTATLIDNTVGSAGDTTSFIIASPVKTMMFVCDNYDAKVDWMSSIQTAITSLLNAHPNNAKVRKEYSVDYQHNRWTVTQVNEQENGDNSAQHGVSQLAQLQKLLALSNKGKIHIKKTCFGVVQEMLGPDLQLVDVCPHYTLNGTFLIFPPSEKMARLFRLTGTLALSNTGVTIIRLQSHLRGCGVTRKGKHFQGKLYDLLPGETKQFAFRGNWAIEVMSGDCADLQVISFSSNKGDSRNDLLGMVSSYDNK